MLVISVKVLLILFLAGIIGWDREQHGRPAGFRTHILVGIGSTIIMIISIKIYEQFPGSDADPGRIAAQVVSGIGFLGAGTILIQGSIVKGLTTAASLWTTAAIGLAVGGGFYFVAVTASLVVFVSLFFLNNIEYGKTKVVKQHLICKMDIDKNETYNQLFNILQSKDCYIKKIKTYIDEVEDELIVDCKLDTKDRIVSEINKCLVELDQVKEVTWVEI